MIKIKGKEVKRSKAHITYEFSCGDEVLTKTMTISAKVYEKLNEKELFMRVRGQVLKQRLKLGRPRPYIKEPTDLEEMPEDPEEPEKEE